MLSMTTLKACDVVLLKERSSAFYLTEKKVWLSSVFVLLMYGLLISSFNIVGHFYSGECYFFLCRYSVLADKADEKGDGLL